MHIQEHPKWKYHATKEAVIVQDADEEAALGDEWQDAPIDADSEVLSTSTSAVASLSTSTSTGFSTTNSAVASLSTSSKPGRKQKDEAAE